MCFVFFCAPSTCVFRWTQCTVHAPGLSIQTTALRVCTLPVLTQRLRARQCICYSLPADPLVVDLLALVLFCRHTQEKLTTAEESDTTNRFVGFNMNKMILVYFFFSHCICDNSTVFYGLQAATFFPPRALNHATYTKMQLFF